LKPWQDAFAVGSNSIFRVVVVAVALTVAGSGLARPAAAQSGSARCVEELSEAEVEARYRTIYRTMKSQEVDARWYYFGWLAIFSGLLAGNVAQAVYKVDGVQARHIVGAVGSGLSIFGMTVFPRAGLRTAFSTRRLRRQPAGTPEERQQRLLYAENMLRRSAGAQYLGGAFPAHGQGVIWGLTSGLLVGRRYNDTQGGLVLGLGGVLLNELRIATQPTASIAAWEDYRTAIKSCMAPTLRQDPKLTVSGGAGGFALRLQWF
jgi:hypothetical protein